MQLDDCVGGFLPIGDDPPRGLPGKPPQQNIFLISQTYVQDANGWHVASILPVANTELK